MAAVVVAVLFLSFVAASLSSAGGLGGGSLYIPILNLVGGLDLKTASSFCAFMVTGGSLSNILFNLLYQSKQPDNMSWIDYDITILSEPCMLLGVSVGVMCNVTFPQWLVTALFDIFLLLSTFKTFKSGRKCWKAESENMRRIRLDADGMEQSFLLVRSRGGAGAEHRSEIPWRKLTVLLMVWLSFFVLHLIIGGEAGKGMVKLRPCGVGYWLLTLSQVPLAIGFTAYILYTKQQQKLDHETDIDKEIVARNQIEDSSTVVFFPLAALLSGILSGLFGIGGGLVMNPFLLHIGVSPQVTAATTTFMILFSASMSSVEYLILGMTAVKRVLLFAAVCSAASVVGLVVLRTAIGKLGRPSLIVFSVFAVMAISTISITCSGAVNFWRDFASGKNIGFKPLCY